MIDYIVLQSFYTKIYMLGFLFCWSVSFVLIWETWIRVKAMMGIPYDYKNLRRWRCSIILKAKWDKYIIELNNRDHFQKLFAHKHVACADCQISVPCENNPNWHKTDKFVSKIFFDIV